MFGRTGGRELYGSLVGTVWGECILINRTRTKRYSMDRLNRSYGCAQRGYKDRIDHGDDNINARVG